MIKIDESKNSSSLLSTRGRGSPVKLGCLSTKDSKCEQQQRQQLSCVYTEFAQHKMKLELFFNFRSNFTKVSVVQWLSRAPHTRKVAGSNPAGNKFVLVFFYYFLFYHNKLYTLRTLNGICKYYTEFFSTVNIMQYKNFQKIYELTKKMVKRYSSNILNNHFKDLVFLMIFNTFLKSASFNCFYNIQLTFL